MPCPSPSLLASYADRALPAEAVEALEDHAASCPDCRDALRLLTDPRGRPAATPRRPYLLQAAAVLMAASLSTLAWQILRTPGPGETPGPTPSLPSGTSKPAWPKAPQALASTGWASEGTDIVPLPGTRMTLARDTQGAPWVSLQAGGAWIRGGGGGDLGSEALRLRTPAGPLALPGTEVWAEASPSPTPSSSRLLLSEARAGEEGTPLRVIPLDGTLRWPGGEAGPGLALSCSAAGITTALVAPEHLAALRRDRLQRLKTLGSWRDLLPTGTVLDAAAPSLSFREGLEGSRWRLLLRLERRNPATEVAVLLPTPGGTGQWTVRLPSRSLSPDADLEILSDGIRFLARLDGRTLMDLPVEAMAGSLEPAAEKASPGLRSWGGAVTVASARSQELP